MSTVSQGILLVLSDRALAEKIAAALRGRLPIAEAASLASARELLRGVNYDLVLSSAVFDDGPVHQLRPALAETPWIVLGEASQQLVAAAAVAAGARGFLTLTPALLEPPVARAWVRALLPKTALADWVENEAVAPVRHRAELLDQVSEAIIVSSLDDQVEYWSGGAQRLYGWSAEEAAGREVSELIADENPEAYHQALVAVLETGQWVGELRQQNRHGDVRIVESRWTLVGDGGEEPSSILRLNRDITENKELESRLQRTQRLENLGTLAGGVAHDINNVLTPIMLSLSLLQDEIQPGRRETLTTLEQATSRAMQMVKQLMWFARGVEGDRIEVELPAVVAELERVLRSTLPSRIEVVSEVSGPLPTVAGDPAQLFQAFEHLCANARYAIADHGRISLSLTEVRVDHPLAEQLAEASSGNYLLLTIADTGGGMAVADLEGVFGPRSSKKASTEGLGLGLAAARSIVQAHGGFIELVSEGRQGTKVRVFLPAIDRSSSVPSAVQPACWGDGRHILLAEDDPIVREITRETLEQQGYRVTTANDGAAAVQIYKELWESIDALVTDITMPLLDGKEAIRILRRLDRSVPVLAISGLAENLSGLAELGSCLVLEKPFSAVELFAKLDDLFAQHQATDEGTGVDLA